MKKKFKLPFKLVGTSVKEMVQILFLVIVVASLAHFLWGEATTTYLWLLALTTWAFLHIKKSSTTWERFEEIDQRDMDFHDEVDRRIEKIEEELKK